MSLRHMKRLEQLNNVSTIADNDDEIDDVLPPPKNKSMFQMRNKAKNKKKKNNSKVDDDIEKELRFIEDENQAPKQIVEETSSEEASIDSLLTIQLKLLKYENEVYRKFGPEAVKAEGGLAGAKGGPRIANRSILVRDAGSHYVEMRGRRVGGVTMVPTDTPDQFEFRFSSDYWQVQGEFAFAVDFGDSAGLLEMLIERISDHVDLLIQASDMLREEGEVPRSADLIERALYILEKAFHPSFNLHSGKCRLDYACKPNRALYITLFLHAYHISLKGCPRTALEVSKAILSLDPCHDPLAVLLVMDNFAIRAHEYKWLINFFEVMQKNGRNLDGLPNMAYSVALAHFHLKEYDKADDLLRKALLRFPNVLKAVADKNSVMMDRTSAGVFDKFYPENLFVDLYAERCAHLFKEANVMQWMEKVCLEIASSPDRPEKPTTPKYPRNLLRHITLSHVNGVKLQPRHLPKADETVYGFDPFPPKTSYGDLTQKLPQRNLDVLDGLPEATINNFLNSLNPNWTGHEDDQNVGSSLRRGVGSLVEAVVDLMGNIMDARNEANNEQEAQGDNPAPNERQDDAQQ
ncbi:transcription factor 25 [Galendromus occidentalis]|uniref:Transcription factor 25 n=1 Tax=Galendromus occidentalis TaxID=34638 RepID=A0AAJ6QWZ3_9ACAR|nr:transcription factor 25 [Galendromus occidentalis]